MTIGREHGEAPGEDPGNTSRARLAGGDDRNGQHTSRPAEEQPNVTNNFLPSTTLSDRDQTLRDMVRAPDNPGRAPFDDGPYRSIPQASSGSSESGGRGRAMADVSVRFAMTNDSEVVLNLSLPQALRLMEAIARKVGETLAERSTQAVGGVPAPSPANGMPSLGPYTPS
jgi:hypothetical protein